MVIVYDDCIETHGKTFSFEAPLEFPDVDSSRTLIDAIEWSKQDTFLAGQVFKSSLGTNVGFHFLCKVKDNLVAKCVDLIWMQRTIIGHQNFQFALWVNAWHGGTF